jgi:hypothetical protein
MLSNRASLTLTTLCGRPISVPPREYELAHGNEAVEMGPIDLIEAGSRRLGQSGRSVTVGMLQGGINCATTCAAHAKPVRRSSNCSSRSGPREPETSDRFIGVIASPGRYMMSESLPLMGNLAPCRRAYRKSN